MYLYANLKRAHTTEVEVKFLLLFLSSETFPETFLVILRPHRHGAFPNHNFSDTLGVPLHTFGFLLSFPGPLLVPLG